MKLALAQINTTVGDLVGNVRMMATAIAAAAREGADLLCFSELALTGYPPRDLLHYPDFITKTQAALQGLCRHVSGPMAVCVGTVMPNAAQVGLPIYNSAVVIQNGKIVFQQHKTLLPNYDVFDEQRYFEPVAQTDVWVWGKERIGITICEDLWFFEKGRYHHDPVAALAQLNPTLVLNLSASPFELGKEKLRLKLLQRAAKTCNAPVAFVNQVGGNDELIFDGGSQVVRPDGTIALALKKFEEDMQCVMASSEPASSQCCRGDEGIPDIHQALILGLRDYARKCGFARVVLGVSGGIDSAVVAALAVEAFGAQAVTGLAMPSPYSSVGSVADAEALAKNLGITLQLLPIASIYNSYRDVLSEDVTSAPDLADENIQARIRGALLMVHSNRTGALLLSTGNKSELAVGYCTLYGDMAGGLAVLADVPKTMVYALARHINTQRELIPQVSIDKAPSAELRPNQADQDSLPPYDILDAILAAYIEQHMPMAAIIAQGFDPAIVQSVIQKVQHNEYKRRQAAPGLKVTGKAFGMGRRLPIACKW